MSKDDKTTELVALGVREASGTFDVMEDLLRQKKDRWSRAIPLMTAGLLLAVIVFQVVIIPVPIWLSSEDSHLSSTNKTVYTTGITVLATLISTLAIGQVRTMWLVRLAKRNSRDSSTLSQARVLLQISGTKDKIRLGWLVALMATLSLITASIVGSMAVTSRERWYSTQFPQFIGGSVWSCWDTYSADARTQSQLAWLNSTTGNFTATASDANDGFWCPSSVVSAVRIDGLSGTGLFAPSGRTATCLRPSSGGEVLCSALGAPVSTNPRCNVMAPFNCMRGVHSRACVPVFTDSPVKCRKIDASFMAGQFDSIAGWKCGVNATTPMQDNTVWWANSSQVLGFCPHPDSPGDMSFVMGTNNSHGRDSFGSLFPNGSDPSELSVAVECTVSLNATLQYRVVQNSSDFEDPYKPYYVPATTAIYSTGEQCTADNAVSVEGGESLGLSNSAYLEQVLNPEARMTAATTIMLTLQATLVEDLLDSAIPLNSQAPPAFNTSENGLDDFLGSLTASMMSIYWGSYSDTLSSITRSGIAQSGVGPWNWVEYSILAERIGPGSWVALLYVLPSICTLVAMVFLWSDGCGGRNGVRRQYLEVPS